MKKLTEQLRVRIPIIQAGMAGGITTPELVAAVANSGALGTIGAGYMSASALKEEIQQTRKLTEKPFAVNLFATNLEAFSKDITDMQRLLNRFRNELDIDVIQDSVKVIDYLQEKVSVILDEKIPIVSTAFGVLSTVLIERLKKNGVTLIGMATNLDEACQLVDAGYDIIVAQGSEAGGHRGTFDVVTYKEGCNIGLFSLVRDFLDNVSVPVVAAGGITSQEQVEVLLSMGVGVQVGTRFLVAKEAGTNDAYRRALMKAGAEDTVITKVFSGRPARAIFNRFIDEVETSRVDPLPFPVQNQLTKDIRSAGKKFEMADFQSLWAGQGIGGITKEETAVEIVRGLMDGSKHKSE
ncbi:NAD(P)H-dependent flavin oxidoreductase [Virgibacillus ndiopensis]|uniref:NAD(P)H-dependent flavin oxidoreductase n=1 Tax=Virgibacillus ndiopensis TaxID=2004408 RepID=UPI000C069831|nr:nitronate monooxygenase [Virgibacillus ndiopensis]